MKRASHDRTWREAERLPGWIATPINLGVSLGLWCAILIPVIPTLSRTLERL